MRRLVLATLAILAFAPGVAEAHRHKRCREYLTPLTTCTRHGRCSTRLTQSFVCGRSVIFNLATRD